MGLFSAPDSGHKICPPTVVEISNLASLSGAKFDPHKWGLVAQEYWRIIYQCTEKNQEQNVVQKLGP